MLCTNARSIGRRFLARNSGSFFLRSLERRAALAGPHECVQRKPRDALGMALRRTVPRAARPRKCRRPATGPHAARAQDVVGRGRQIVGAVGDVGVRCRATCPTGHSLPCRRTSRRSRGARTNPSPTSRDGRERSDRTSVATPSTSRGRIAPAACLGVGRRIFPRGTAEHRPCAPSARCLRRAGRQPAWACPMCWFRVRYSRLR